MQEEYNLPALRENFIFSSIKKIFGWKFGGKFQSGGSFGVSYTSAAGAGNPYLM